MEHVDFIAEVLASDAYTATAQPFLYDEGDKPGDVAFTASISMLRIDSWLRDHKEDYDQFQDQSDEAYHTWRSLIDSYKALAGTMSLIPATHSIISPLSDEGKTL